MRALLRARNLFGITENCQKWMSTSIFGANNSFVVDYGGNVNRQISAFLHALVISPSTDARDARAKRGKVFFVIVRDRNG